MKRIHTCPRPDWQKRVEELGFGFHTAEVPYWNERAYYSFALQEIEQIEKATRELWNLCLHAVGKVIKSQMYSPFHIPECWKPLIEKSWFKDHPTLYGRFDLAYSESGLKLLEFNADTPTSLFEAGIVQWFWLQDFDAGKDQYNSIHEKLLAHWKYIAPLFHPGTVHFSCIKDSLEDLTTVEYLRDCAIQSGLKTSFMYVEDIGWDERVEVFVDPDQRPVRNMFKLYPWEWLINEPFGPLILEEKSKIFWMEPPWKMILSNKAILPLLWEMNPGHPLLLPAHFDEHGMANYVKKPLLSREGSNVEIVTEAGTLETTDGEYGEEGFIFQRYFPLPDLDGNHPILGSWIIGGQPAGMGIRESDHFITDNCSRFVPHLIDG